MVALSLPVSLYFSMPHALCLRGAFQFEHWQYYRYTVVAGGEEPTIWGRCYLGAPQGDNIDFIRQQVWVWSH